MDAIAVYKDSSISTQNQGRLIVMLYEGAIRFLKQAAEAMEAGDIVEKGRYISKAMDIIHELDRALDMDTGGEVSTNLRRLYDFMSRSLLTASINADIPAVRDVIVILEDLNEGWKAISD